MPGVQQYLTVPGLERFANPQNVPAGYLVPAYQNWQTAQTFHNLPTASALPNNLAVSTVPTVGAVPTVAAVPTVPTIPTIPTNPTFPAVVAVPTVPTATAVPTVSAVTTGPAVPVLTRSEIRDDFNQFALSYSTANGIAVAQQGALKPLRSETGEIENVLVQRGSYAYYGPDGRLYKVSYIADENGNNLRIYVV